MASPLVRRDFVLFFFLLFFFLGTVFWGQYLKLSATISKQSRGKGLPVEEGSVGATGGMMGRINVIRDLGGERWIGLVGN